MCAHAYSGDADNGISWVFLAVKQSCTVMHSHFNKHPWPVGTVVRDHNDKRIGVVEGVLSNAPDDCAYTVRFKKRGWFDTESRHQEGLEWVRPATRASLF